MTRLRELAKEMGKDVDPLELAVKELQTYRRALRETRFDRERLRAALYGRFGKAS